MWCVNCMSPINLGKEEPQRQMEAFEPSQDLPCFISQALPERKEKFLFIFEHMAVLQEPIVNTQVAGLSLKPVYSLCSTECVSVGLEIAAVVISTCNQNRTISNHLFGLSLLMKMLRPDLFSLLMLHLRKRSVEKFLFFQN